MVSKVQLSVFCVFLLLVSCDYYCDEEIEVINNSDSEITVKYKIEYSAHYPTDSIRVARIPSMSKQLIHLDSNSHGMKCEDVSSRQDRIYFLDILEITNREGISCSRNYNDCSEWQFDLIKKEGVQDIQRYSLSLNNKDFGE